MLSCNARNCALHVEILPMQVTLSPPGMCNRWPVPLLSLNPGVRLAKLYCRSLYAALTNAPLDRSGPVVPFTTLLRQDLARRPQSSPLLS